jgi:hypothetical protein
MRPARRCDQHVAQGFSLVAQIPPTSLSGIERSISGRQHARFGVWSSHFVGFGDALIWGLEQQFGAAFTPQLRESWITLYSTVQSEMMCAAGLANENVHHCASPWRHGVDR